MATYMCEKNSYNLAVSQNAFDTDGRTDRQIDKQTTDDNHANSSTVTLVRSAENLYHPSNYAEFDRNTCI